MPPATFARAKARLEFTSGPIVFTAGNYDSCACSGDCVVEVDAAKDDPATYRLSIEID